MLTIDIMLFVQGVPTIIDVDVSVGVALGICL